MKPKKRRKTGVKHKSSVKNKPKTNLYILGAGISLGVILIVLSFVLIGSMVKHPQPSVVIESTERILNPGIGFYRTAPFNLTPDGGGDIHLYSDYNLHHLRIDLSTFSHVNNASGTDLELTSAALEKLDANLKKLYDHEKCAIVRFAYDKFNGSADQEPSENMILRHIEQVSQILNRYPHTITAIEVGLVGKWGEMHSSVLANPTTIDHLISKFLTCTQNFPILVRTPKMIYHYLDITLADIDNFQIDATSPAYRLGIFNDGYLGSDSDLGTYQDREREIQWLSHQTAHLPFGGEVMNTDLSNLENCLSEMQQIHLSYLNYEWNNKTTQSKWVNTFYTKVLGNDDVYDGMTAQRYIENRMGYRFLLDNQSINATHHQIKIKFDVTNVGFGNLTQTANATIILQNQAAETFYFSVTDFTGQGAYNLQIEHELSAGDYKVYYCPHLDMKNGLPYYTLAFANQNIYDANLKANLIGKVIIK